MIRDQKDTRRAEMSENSTNVPKIRFPGFTDAWELRKLKNVANYIRGSFPQPYTNSDFYDEENGKPFVQVADIGFNLKLNPDTKAHISKIAEPKSRFVEAGKVVVALQGSIEKSIGRTAITQYDAYFDRTILIFEDYKVPIDKLYFAQVIKKLFEREKERAWGATISTITKEHLNDFVIGIPTIEEQKLLGNLFANIDETITLHQRKLDHLQDEKKSLLQKMFPKNGADIPEIRFPGFTDAWEQRVFSELVTRVSKSSEVDELPRVEYEDIVSGQGELNKDIFAKESDKKGIEFEVGDTLFGKLRPYLQNWLLADFKGIAVGDWWVLRPNKMDNKFIYSLIQSSKYQTVANLATGTKMPRSDWNVVSKTEFSVPTDKGEQAKIGQLFNQLDNLITLHQRKLNHLQEQKKSLLQQMFV